MCKLRVTFKTSVSVRSFGLFRYLILAFRLTCFSHHIEFQRRIFILVSVEVRCQLTSVTCQLCTQNSVSMKRIDPQFLNIIQPLNFPPYSPLRTQTRSIATNYAGGD